MVGTKPLGNNGEIGLNIIGDSYENQFAIYETLDSAVKRVVQQAPVNMDMEEVKMICLRYGEQSAWVIEQYLKQAFPGWEMRE